MVVSLLWWWYLYYDGGIFTMMVVSLLWWWHLYYDGGIFTMMVVSLLWWWYLYYDADIFTMMVASLLRPTRSVGDFPGGLVVKKPPCYAGDMGSIPGRGTKIPHAREWVRPHSATNDAVCNSGMSDSQSHGLFSPWNSPGQNTGVGSLSLLQGVFPTQGSNPGLSFFISWAIGQVRVNRSTGK